MTLRVLMLVQDEERVIFDHLYQSIGAHCQLDLRRVSSCDQANLSHYFKSIDTASYDRIILFLRFKKEIRQLAFIRTIPNLVILEHDAWQNYYIQSKYKGKFSRHYRGLPWARQIVSGYTLCKKLRAEGFDTSFVSKGYDDSVLKNLNVTRDIDFGFLGSIHNQIYAKRKTFLELAKQRFNLQITRTTSGEDYLETLNRIQFFLSCDYEFGEYMLKNFEAMACGCVLFAWNQGNEENNALGFVDMENIVLYASLDEIEHKLSLLRNNRELVQTIAKNGQALVEHRFKFSLLGKQIVDSLTPPLRPKQSNHLFLDILRYGFYR